MATREWSQAEREKAAEQVAISETTGKKFEGAKPEILDSLRVVLAAQILNSAEIMTGRVSVDLQCEVNFLRAQIEEARGLLCLARAASTDVQHKSIWAIRNKAWLDRNHETK
jgi:hypothetical protein